MGIDSNLGPSANEETQAKKRKSQKTRDLAWRGAVSEICSSVSGRQFIWWLVNDVAGFFASYPAPLSTDAAHFAEGKRWVAAQVLDAIKRADPALHQKVLSEGFDPFKDVTDAD
jgi:hypothetical protein